MPHKLGEIESLYEDLRQMYETNYFEDEDNMTKRELKFKVKLIELCQLIIEENEIEDDDEDYDSDLKELW